MASPPEHHTSGDPLTLMCVHAHPDDEAIGTGGVLARYASEGVRTVLVTCTNGEMGDSPEGLKPEHEGHDPDRVAALRQDELKASAELLGVQHLELLGFRDSGMMGWPQNADPNSFWSIPVEEGANRLSVLMERYRPQVVVTYDDNGFYGHPDHIQAHRITLAAVEKTGIPQKLYFTAVPRSGLRAMMQRMREAARERGAEVPEEMEDPDPPFGTPDEEISAVVDVSACIHRKLAALKAHASQVTENSWFLTLPAEIQEQVFGREAFVRHLDSTGAPLPEEDLFAGLR